jgi:hypothetical protein
MDRIEYIKKLLNTKYKQEPSQSTVLGNFFALITIVIVSISIIYYINYIQPAQEAKALRVVEITKHQEFINQRAKRIALSHKLNKKDYNETN